MKIGIENIHVSTKSNSRISRISTGYQGLFYPGYHELSPLVLTTVSGGTGGGQTGLLPCKKGERKKKGGGKKKGRKKGRGKTDRDGKRKKKSTLRKVG